MTINIINGFIIFILIIVIIVVLVEVNNNQNRILGTNLRIQQGTGGDMDTFNTQNNDLYIIRNNQNDNMSDSNMFTLNIPSNNSNIVGRNLYVINMSSREAMVNFTQGTKINRNGNENVLKPGEYATYIVYNSNNNFLQLDQNI